ncbi:MAG: hypothetical protein ACLQMT_04660 [Candidatus Acidiferrales bacterium]
MSAAPSGHCRKAMCANTIPPTLAAEQLCLDHFLEEAFVRTAEALERCREGRPIHPKGLEWLLADALAIVKNLEEGAGEPSPEQRDKMLELLLILSNLQEYAAHHSIRLDLPA